MSLTVNGRYIIQSPRHYRHFFSRTSDRLYRAAFKQYRAFLNGSIDDPSCDEDVVNWLTSIISEKVNNPRSSFYIHG